VGAALWAANIETSGSSGVAASPSSESTGVSDPRQEL
jgi:hypothetical protein